MTPRAISKTMLLRGCAAAALLAGGALAAGSAQAQGFQADGNVVQGSATIDDTTPGITRITVDTQDTVIDWIPNLDPVTLDAETFLPFGNQAVFQNGVNNTDFAVLNRILPDANNNPVLFEGLVQSFLVDPLGLAQPGGFVAFYSPSGIIVGPTARFEVPQLMLTTQAVDITTINGFATGAGSLFLSGNTGDIDIQAGSTFVGTPEDSFLIVASPQISMAGDASYNGSIAYVASNSVFLTHTSGLFDIIITSGVSGGGQRIIHTGSSGGPSSTGAGDEHVIYGATRAAIGSDPVSMLFSGNLGFQPAASATVVNGDIILSANYNVTGRTVDGDDNRQGWDSFFDGRSQTPGVPADIILEGVTATSGLLAIASGQTNLDATGASSSFSADLLLVGREQAVIDVGAGLSVIVGGDLFVSARNFGENTQAINDDNAVGGFAGINAGVDALVQVQGRTMVAASAIPGLNFITNTIGSGTGGTAQIFASGGTIDLVGTVDMEAYARTDQTSGPFTGNGAMQGGSVQFVANSGGTLTTQGQLDIDARASTPQINAADPGLAAGATGGTVLISIGDGGGNITVAQDIVADASASIATSTYVSGTGPLAQGGTTDFDSSNGGFIDVGGEVFLTTQGNGGFVLGGGSAGTGIGGNANVRMLGGDAAIAGRLALDVQGTASNGEAGGDAQGGNIDISISGATLSLGTIAQFFAAGFAGSGTGAGNGGAASGGTLLISLDTNGQFSIADTSQSTFDIGANGGGAVNGAGGDASGGTASILVEGAGSTLSFVDTLAIDAIATGGASTLGAGGEASGALVQIAVQNGGAMSVGNALTVDADADGGDGVTGGLAQGGLVAVDLLDGDLSVTGDLTFNTPGSGGFGSGAGLGGDGIGGPISISATGTSTLTVGGTSELWAQARGGNAVDGDGGEAVGGDISVTLADTAALLADRFQMTALSLGGSSTTGTGGVGTGGLLTFATTGLATVDITNALGIFASGTGGAGAVGGDGFGGDAGASATGGSTWNTGSISINTNGTSGQSQNGDGANGTGGEASLIVSGGSAITNGPQGLAVISAGTAAAATGGVGGIGTGGTATISVTGAGSTLSSLGATTLINANAFGGTAQSPGFAGGQVNAGQATLSISDLAFAEFSDLFIFASASAGASVGGGASASGGDVVIDVTDAGSELSVAASLRPEANALAGDGATGGNAFGGTIDIVIQNGASASLATTQTNATAIGGDGTTGAGGEGTGGIVGLAITDASVTTTDSFSLTSRGNGGASTDADGASGFGGLVDVTLSNSTLDIPVTDFLSINADARGGLGNSPGFRGGDGVAGDSSVFITNSSLPGGGGISVVSTGIGETGFDGGSGTGGDVSITIEGATTGIFRQIQVQSNGTNSPVVDGTTGDGTGGDASIIIQGGSGLSVGVLAVNTSGNAGQSTNGNTGNGFGGNATLIIDNASVDSVGTPTQVRTLVQSRGTGGRADNGVAGDAVGGDVALVVSGGARVDLPGLVVSSVASGGFSDFGTGGSATAGNTTVDVTGVGTNLVVGTSSRPAILNQADGRNANAGAGIGGSADGGTVSVVVDDGATLVLPVIAGALTSQPVMGASVTAGGSSVDGGSGGSATGANVSVLVGGGGTIDAGTLVVQNSVTGGSSLDPNLDISGGDAISNTIEMLILEGSSFTGTLNISEVVTGGTASNNGVGGNGTAGNVSLLVADSTVTLTGTNVVEAIGQGGDGATGGAASSGDVVVDLTDSLMTGTDLTVSSIANAGSGGGNATSGLAQFFADGSSTNVDLASLTVLSNTQVAAVGFGTSGTAELFLDTATASIQALTVNSDSSGDGNTTPGHVFITNTNGALSTDTITMSALGLNAGPGSQLTSDGGTTTIITQLGATATGDIVLAYANGGSIIGGNAVADLSASFDLTAGGLLTLQGDSAAAPGIASLGLFTSSNDLDIIDDPSILATNVVLQSTNDTATAVIGGTALGAGFSLLADEIARIDATNLEISVPQLAVATDLAAIVDSFAVQGSGGTGSLEYLRLLLRGPSEIIGIVSYENAGVDDVLEINSSDFLHVVLPTGGIAMSDPGGDVAGNLRITGSSFFAADRTLAAQILADADDPAIAPALLDDGGNTAPSAYISAGGVEFSLSNLLFGQNTGANGVYGGITVGSGGLVISNPDGGATDLRVIAFGLQDDGGVQVTNDDWFFLVDFDTDRANSYTAASTFNNCIIVTSTCPTIVDPDPDPDPVEQPIILIINHRLLEQPLAPQTASDDETTSDEAFGFDFPSLLDAPLISEAEVIREPVTSGNDSAVTALIAPNTAEGDE